MTVMQIEKSAFAWFCVDSSIYFSFLNKVLYFGDVHGRKDLFISIFRYRIRLFMYFISNRKKTYQPGRYFGFMEMYFQIFSKNIWDMYYPSNVREMVYILGHFLAKTRENVSLRISQSYWVVLIPLSSVHFAASERNKTFSSSDMLRIHNLWLFHFLNNKDLFVFIKLW